MAKDERDKSPGKKTPDIESYLDERVKMDSLFKEKFTRVITVMFTDLKGSTTITETQGDLATRMMLKQHNDALKPIISNNNGVLVKTMGDGTMSYFPDAQSAVIAASQFQETIDKMNLEKKFSAPILVRIGINTGEGIVEQNDIYGDVVNVASRFESSANAGEIYISESAYNAMADKTAVYCRFIKTTTLKGKKDPFKIYKVFWKTDEIEADKKAVATGQKAEGAEKKKGMPPLLKLLLLALIPFLVVFLLMKGGSIIKQFQPESEKRSLTHSATDTKKEDKK
ncbi:MAG: adenylate/guanylate cyclase domain-containing protein [Deltaproteobacteria bacterium]|nr:adenylate/guanylate cyclase domain-containing protein [Deltaproteobacteria bacterium]